MASEEDPEGPGGVGSGPLGCGSEGASARRRIEVGDALAGQRIDRALATVLGLPRAEIRRLLERSGVQLDGRKLGLADKGRALRRGEWLEVEAFRRPEQQRAAGSPGLDLRILAEGDGWVAVDKPAGVAVHPLSETQEGTILGALRLRHPEIDGVGEGGLRSGVVHRLDVDTSGVLLFATTARSWQRLRAAFSNHSIQKEYRAIVAGRVERAFEQRLRLAVARHRPARVRVMDHDAPGRGPAARVIRQLVEPLEVLDGATLVRVRPHTGFLHQVRVSLAHVGHPILGDSTYAEADPVARAAPRHLLHASRIELEEIRAESQDPPDFVRALQERRPGR